MPKKPILYSIIKQPNHEAAFYGNWLLRAAEAENHLQKLRAEPNVVVEQLERLHDTCIPEFILTAIHLLESVVTSKNTFVPMDSYEAELLALFSVVGLLIPTTTGYDLSIPQVIEQTDVERAIIFVTGTEDEEHRFHPENLLLCEPIPPAQLRSGALARW